MFIPKVDILFEIVSHQSPLINLKISPFSKLVNVYFSTLSQRLINVCVLLGQLTVAKYAIRN